MARRQHGLITRAQAVEFGLHPRAIDRRIAAGRFEKVKARVYRLGGAPITWKQQVLAVCLSLKVVASHRTAAKLWELDGVESAPLEFTGGINQSRPGDDVRVYRRGCLPDCDVTAIDGIPVTTPARTLLDLGGVLGRRALELALEDVLRRRLSSLARLRWRVDSLCGPGVAGCRPLAELIESRSPSLAATDSALETRIWDFLRERHLPMPLRQFRIRSGRRHARPDFAYPSNKLALEGHSFRHHSSKASWDRDHARHLWLVDLGWEVIYVTDGDLRFRPNELERQIRKALGLEMPEQELFVT